MRRRAFSPDSLARALSHPCTLAPSRALSMPSLQCSLARSYVPSTETRLLHPSPTLSPLHILSQTLSPEPSFLLSSSSRSLARSLALSHPPFLVSSLSLSLSPQPRFPCSFARRLNDGPASAATAAPFSVRFGRGKRRCNAQTVTDTLPLVRSVSGPAPSRSNARNTVDVLDPASPSPCRTFFFWVRSNPNRGLRHFPFSAFLPRVSW